MKVLGVALHGVGLMLLLIHVAQGRHLHRGAIISDLGNAYLNISSSSSGSSSSSWPKLPVYDDPWTQQHVALVYAHQLRDGVGAQTMRMLEIYAVASSLGIGYLHRPIKCVGHVDGHVHYRTSECTNLKDADMRLVHKLRRLITLPSTITEQQVSIWDQKFIPKLGWNTLASLATEARQRKRPLLITTEFATSILHNFTDMYLSVPQFQPKNPSARLFCARPAADSPSVPGRPWLLQGLRVAVHFRRGDIAESKRWADRMLSPHYYVNVVKKVMEILDTAGCIYTVEIYTETPRTSEGRAELQLLQDSLPGSVALVSTDLAWSWQMLATADVLVMSNSAFSLSAALLNPDAYNVFFPNAKQSQFRVPMKHWVMPLDRNGTLATADVDSLRRRLSSAPAAAAAAAASTSSELTVGDSKVAEATTDLSKQHESSVQPNSAQHNIAHIIAEQQAVI